MKIHAAALILSAWAASPLVHAALGDPDPSYTPQVPANCDGPIAPLEDGGAFVGSRFFSTASSTVFVAPVLVKLQGIELLPYGWAIRDDGVIEIGVRQYPNLTPVLYVVSPLTGVTTEAGRIVPRGSASWFAREAKVDPLGGVVIARGG